MRNIVMLIDDNETDNFISRKIIELNGFAKEVLVMGSGKSALEYLDREECNLDRLPDLIFLDINMPIVDGFVFLYEFEKFNDQLREKCKVAILSSSDNKNDVRRIMDNENVQEFITKPLSSESLKRLDFELKVA